MSSQSDLCQQSETVYSRNAAKENSASRLVHLFPLKQDQVYPDNPLHISMIGSKMTPISSL